jgi:hypothetical protein
LTIKLDVKREAPYRSISFPSRAVFMLKRFLLPCLFPAVLLSTTAGHAQYPILTMVANKVIERYQNSTCEQLWANRGKQPGMREQRLIGLLNNDPQMRQAFFDQIAGPVMNKMFTCGMIP